MQATSRSALRPKRFRISASVALSGLDSRNCDGNLALKTRFSGGEVLVPQEEFLIHSTGHVRE